MLWKISCTKTFQNINNMKFNKTIIFFGILLVAYAALPIEASSIGSSEDNSETDSSASSEQTSNNSDSDSGEVSVQELAKLIEDTFDFLGKLFAETINTINNDKTTDISSETINIQDTEVPMQPRTFKTLSWILKSVLRTLKGINCSIKGVLNIKEATEQMLNNFHGCAVDTSKQIQAVLDSANQILKISANIIGINDSVCNNAAMSDDDEAAKVSTKCSRQLRSQIVALNKQINTTTKLIKKVPKDSGDCVTGTFSTYQQVITGFPGFVKSCSKLVS